MHHFTGRLWYPNRIVHDKLTCRDHNWWYLNSFLKYHLLQIDSYWIEDDLMGALQFTEFRNLNRQFGDQNGKSTSYKCEIRIQHLSIRLGIACRVLIPSICTIFWSLYARDISGKNWYTSQKRSSYTYWYQSRYPSSISILFGTGIINLPVLFSANRKDTVLIQPPIFVSLRKTTKNEMTLTTGTNSPLISLLNLGFHNSEK